MTKIRMLVSCLLIVLLASLPWATINAAEKSGVNKTQTVVRTQIWKAITGGKIGSATVAIMDNGATVYAEGFGAADRERNLPVNKYTLFNIASVSKVYCATAVMLLVDDGKVSLDKPVTRYIPEFTMADSRYKDITVRMLLNHSSGLPGTIAPNAFGYEYNPKYTASVLEVLAASHLKHRPGEMAPYCNDGFTLAEILVARVSGKSYIDFLEERIFRPLALTRTGPSVGQRAGENGAVIARYYNASGKAEPLEVLSVLGSGGLSATAEDLCKFADSFSPGGRHILSEASLAEMKKAQPAEFTDKLRLPASLYGLGWDFAGMPGFKAQGIDMFGKSGGVNNYASMLFTVPDKRISVAVITAGPQKVAMDIAKTVMETYLADKGYYVKAPQQVKLPVEARTIPEELLACAGYYSTGNTLVKVELDSTEKTMSYYAVTDGQASKVATAVYNDGYFHAKDAEYYFTTVDGRQYLVRHNMYDTDSLVCQKLEAAAAPQELRIPVDGRKWLRRNARAYEQNGIADTHIVTTHTFKELPGYIDFFGPKKVESAVTAGPAINALRDLFEVRLFDKYGATWAWVTGLIYMPADEARDMTGREANVTIGREGYNEWLRLAKSAVLSFEIPAKGRVIVFDGSGKLLYDNVFDGGAVYAPAGSYIEMAADPAASFRVKASY